jgi:mannose-6-phosphate isomerase
VLFALANAAEALPERSAELSAAAEDLLSAIRRGLTHTEGGFLAGEGAPAFLANPIMHLFEGALAWTTTRSDGPWRALAEELAELFLARLYDAEHGRIPEVYDARWRVIAAPGGDVILEPGHHFEWSWLMERWAEASGDPRASVAANELYMSGERGVDPASGLVYDGMRDDFSVQAPTSRLWPQTERVKAALSRARRADVDRESCFRAASSAASALESYLQTQATGLWTDEPGGGHTSRNPAPGSSLYHIVGAVRALAAG